MTELAPFICGPCRTDRHTSCRGPEWACGCPHARGLTAAPAAASPHPPGVDAAAGGVAESARGSGAAGATLPRPAWWGENGCRFAAVDPAHVCRDSFGAPLRPGVCCFAEARQALRDEIGQEFVA